MLAYICRLQCGEPRKQLNANSSWEQTFAIVPQRIDLWLVVLGQPAPWDGRGVGGRHSVGEALPVPLCPFEPLPCLWWKESPVWAKWTKGSVAPFTSVSPVSYWHGLSGLGFDKDFLQVPNHRKYEVRLNLQAVSTYNVARYNILQQIGWQESVQKFRV